MFSREAHGVAGGWPSNVRAAAAVFPDVLPNGSRLQAQTVAGIEQRLYMLQGQMLVEIRPGRRIWIEVHAASDQGPLHGANTIAMLVHGSCARQEQYAAQIPVLQRAGLEVLAFDYLGCGRSQKPRDFHAYAADELYQDLRAVFARYSKGFDRVVLVGHSYGCYLVNRLASAGDAARHVAAVVCIGAGFPLPGAFRMRWIFFLPTLVLGWLQPWLTDQFIRLAFHPATFQSQPELVALERGRSLENPPHMFRAFHLQAMGLFRDAAEYVRWLRAVRTPVLIAAGDKDLLTPLDGMGKITASYLRDAGTCMIPLAGHQVHEEQPDELNKHILAFLKHHIGSKHGEDG